MDQSRSEILSTFYNTLQSNLESVNSWLDMGAFSVSLNQNDLRVDWKLLNSIEGQLPILFKLHSYRPGNIILEQDTAHPDHILIKNNAEVATYKGSYNVLFSFLPFLFPLSRFPGMNLGVLDYSEFEFWITPGTLQIQKPSAKSLERLELWSKKSMDTRTRQFRAFITAWKTVQPDFSNPKIMIYDHLELLNLLHKSFLEIQDKNHLVFTNPLNETKNSTYAFLFKFYWYVINTEYEMQLYLTDTPPKKPWSRPPVFDQMFWGWKVGVAFYL